MLFTVGSDELMQLYGEFECIMSLFECIIYSCYLINCVVKHM